MKERKMIRSLAIALGALILWGNVISFLLTPEEYGTVIKTVDFATVLFLLAVLITVIFGTVRERRKAREKDKPDSP